VAAGFHTSCHVSKKKRAVSGRLTNVLQTGQTQQRRSPLMNPGFVQKKETVVVSTDQRGERGRRWLVVMFCVSSLLSLCVTVIGQ
jgi:hypothetical protein